MNRNITRTTIEKLLVLTFAIALWLALPLQAGGGTARTPAPDPSRAPDYERKIEESYTIRPEAALKIEHSMGDLEIETFEDSKIQTVLVKVHIEVRGEQAEEFGELIRIEIDEDSDPFKVITHYPKNKQNEWKNISFGVTLEIVMPAGHSLDARNSFGSIEITGVHGAVKAETNCGNLEVEEVYGDMTLVSTFGSIKLKESRGKADIRGTNGKIEVQGLAAGDLRVRNSFGKIDIEEIEGSVDLANTNGGVAIDRVGGSVTTDVAFGDQSFDQIGGFLRVTGKNSEVRAEDIRGPVTVATAFGRVSLKRAAQSARLELKNGGCKAEQVGGDIDVENQFGDITLKAIGGSCRVVNKNGSVSLSGIAKDCAVDNSFGPIRLKGVAGNLEVECRNGNLKAGGLAYSHWVEGEELPNRITLSVTMGSVEISLPKPPSFRLDASTTFGKIESDFEIHQHNRRLTSESCKAHLGDGKAEIVIRSSNGSVRIKDD